eukprot:729046-Hanusia_phi.AAC.4
MFRSVVAPLVPSSPSSVASSQFSDTTSSGLDWPDKNYNPNATGCVQEGCTIPTYELKGFLDIGNRRAVGVADVQSGCDLIELADSTCR